MSEIPEDEFRAMWRDWLKNPSVARQVRGESEGRMKRYSPDISNIDEEVFMEESSAGEYYSRTDLIAAGCLVPVPVGEACKIGDLHRHQLLTRGRTEIWIKGSEDRWGACIRSIIANKETAIANTTLIQPVRLVPLAELENDHG